MCSLVDQVRSESVPIGSDTPYLVPIVKFIGKCGGKIVSVHIGTWGCKTSQLLSGFDDNEPTTRTAARHPYHDDPNDHDSHQDSARDQQKSKTVETHRRRATADGYGRPLDRPSHIATHLMEIAGRETGNATKSVVLPREQKRSMTGGKPKRHQTQTSSPRHRPSICGTGIRWMKGTHPASTHTYGRDSSPSPVLPS